MPRQASIAAAALVLAACVNMPPVNRVADAPLAAVERVDLERYAGLWHEAARLPNQFERDCVAATAAYTRRPDGLIGVRNVCIKADGAEEDVEGRAKVVDPATNAKLKVSFFGPFFVGDYWVIDLALDYSWAIVGEPRGRYLWVLTRAPKVDDATKAALSARVAARGYDAAKLYWNPGRR
jgi:apolipoprotein D and lipocalin family protein